MKKVLGMLLLAMLMLSPILAATPMAKCEEGEDPALLRLWADVGEYVGPHPDAWIHESWVVSGVASFNLFIDAMLYPAYDVYLAVAVDTTTGLVSITIGGTTIYPGDFTYGEVTWPTAAGGGTLPRHGVYPTWYALVPFGDIDTGWDYQTYPWEYWAYRESISVTIEATGPVKVHFDAQGVVASGPQAGKPDSSPFSHDLTCVPEVVIPPEATISGVKFHDRNADGDRDAEEEGLEGWTIQLWKLDTDWVLVDETTTGAAGDYVFTVDAAGTYRVKEVLEEGWMQTAPPAPGYYEFYVELGGVYTDKDFGNIELGSISGAKFYDADVDGLWDVGVEPAIEGWKVHLTGTNIKGDTVDEYAFTDADGKFIFENLLPGSYIVTEVFPPAPPTWVATTATSFSHDLEEGEDYVSPLDFGNVCLEAGHGGLTLGFWTNKNGQPLITSGDVAALNALNLYKPPGWAYPPFSTTSLTTAKAQIKNYLLSATAVDMRWMLSAQLIATTLNVRHGFLSSSTIVYVGPSTYVPSGFITIGNIMSNANTALTLGTSASARATQEYWKNLLDGLNNNRLPFVCSGPCLPIVYP